MDPTITKASTGNERLVAACAESQSTLRGPNRTRFLAVQAVIRAKMQCDKKTLLADADASKKRNLLLVGGHADNPVEVCGEGNADAERPCLGNLSQLPMTMRSVIRSHRTTWTSLIIVVRLHAFKTAAQFLSALAEKFQLRRKARRARWSILAWGLWDGLRTGVLATVRLLSKSL